MRRTLAALILVVASCALATPRRAHAQEAASVAACVGAAITREGLQQCKGVVSAPCMREPEGLSTHGMIMCNSDEAEQWQALLDREAARIGLENPGRAPLFANAQSAWAAWRELECRYHRSEAAGGSAEGVITTACHADLIADRAIALLWAQSHLPY